MIPSLAECLRLMDLYRMLDNIRNHSFMVAAIAELLAARLNTKRAAIDLQLTVAAAFLHDIGKTPCLNTSKNHAKMGRDICVRHNFAELGPLVEQHVILDADSYPAVELSAKEIVYYADKRVNHDQVVSLDERMDYIQKRYGGYDDPIRYKAIKDNFQRCHAIEDGLFADLDFVPEQLAARVVEYTSVFLVDVPFRISVKAPSECELK